MNFVQFFSEWFCYLSLDVRIPNQCLELKSDDGKWVSIAELQTDRQTDGQTHSCYYNIDVWEICYQKYLVSSNFGPKFEKKWFSPIFFTKTKHFSHPFESYITSAFYWYIWQWNKPPKCIIFPPGGFVALQSARAQQ